MKVNIISNLYDFFLANRHKVIRPILSGILLFAVVVGAGYRIVNIKENFDINNGFEFFVNMASHFWTEPGGYNHDESLKIKKNPDDYVFSRHPKEPARGSFENEKGWAFILSLIIKEGTKGISNIAFTVVRYQLMLDLLVIVLLFFSGKSIAGPLGGAFAAILYALFKPSINMTSWVVYYYWAIPFSALSIFFWTVLYKPEEKRYSLKYSALLFLLYGMTMGLATSVRLGFLFLPVILSPLIFFRERVFKRGLVLLLAMLIGYSMLLMPQILITYKHYDKLALSVRGKWHNIVQGLGFYPNPFGIKDGGDLTAVDWAIDRGGPDLNKKGMQAYDKFMKREGFRFFKERPDIFIMNFKHNLYGGITMTSHYSAKGSLFYKIMQETETTPYPYSRQSVKLAKFFPWLVLLSIFVFLFFWKQRFASLISVVLHGLYTVAILAIYFPPVWFHTSAYFPAFVLLLGVSMAIVVRGTLSTIEGGARCWINGRSLSDLPAVARECFHEDWDKVFIPEGIKHAPTDKQRIYQLIKWTIASSILVILFVVLPIPKTIRVNTYIDKIKTGETVNTGAAILNPETNGSFEEWSSAETPFPDEWGILGKKAGDVHRAIEIEKVKIGKSSLEVFPDKLRTTAVYFSIPSDKLYYLIGKTITVSGWVKSDNKTAQKIKISIYNNDIDPIKHEGVYYKNSGEWEHLTFIYKVPDDIREMLIDMNVDSGADAPAYFDGIELKVE